MEEALSIEIQQDSNAFVEIETEISESQMEANALNENRSQNEWLVSALENLITRPESLFSFDCRFERIPDRLRKVNEQAYTPNIVSIGPFHHFDKKLEPMEKLKVRYLKSFIARANLNSENLANTMREMEERIYCCYAEASLGMDRDDFLKLILVDAIFILELLVRSCFGCPGNEALLLIDDQMVSIVTDLVLLENQLPFFVLEKLFNLNPEWSCSSSLIDLTFKFFDPFNVQEIAPQNVTIEHFTDLIRIFQLPQPQNGLRRVAGSEFVPLMFSATLLNEAGVKFQVNSSRCLLDITFNFKTGVLEMPCLELYDSTEALIRNVMAFERYCFGEKTYVSDYYFFLDCLVNTTKDMELLCDGGIIRNLLGDNEAATSLVNKIGINVSFPGINSNHNRIFKELNDFYKRPWHKWRATLRHQYFSTPWRIASTIAAITLLVFTFVQTVCSIIQVMPKG